MTKMIVANGGLNLRMEPDRNSANIGTMPRFSVVDVVETRGDWHRVSGGFRGWAYAQYLADFSHAGLCIGFVLSEEGGYTDHHDDPGNWTGGIVGKGELRGTKFGISALAYPHLDIRNLSLGEAKGIYYRDWFKFFETLPWPISLYRFDTAVNMGKGGESYILKGWNGEDPAHYLECRRDYYRGLFNFNNFGRAWLGRVDRCEEFGRSVSPEQE